MLENNNNVAINVVGYEEITEKPFFYIARLSQKTGTKELLNVLLVTNAHTSHFVWIKNFSGFISRGTKNKCKKFPCFRCWRG